MPTKANHYQSDLEYYLGRDFDRLRGRLAGFFEAIGLPEKQEKAAISLLKSLTYDSQRDLIEKLREQRQPSNVNGSQRRSPVASD